MAYSIVGILAIFVHLIVNSDVLIAVKNKNKFRWENYYIAFLLCVIAYHVTDGFWGFLYDAKLATAVFVDTTIYFLAMAASILFWGFFVYHYLGAQSKTNKAILYTGVSIFVLQVIAVVVNFFVPALFSVSEKCEYKAEWLRYLILSAQILVFVLVSVYAFVSAFRARDSMRRRMLTVGILGFFMATAITLQVFFPLLPMYSMGYLFGVCILHTFVIRDELTNRLHELNETKHRISIDPLTGVHSKYAYIDAEAQIEDAISNNAIQAFAVVVFDINDLKVTNDTFGHEEGDKYIKKSTDLIRECFKDVPIYRVGGDEFAAILMDEHYDNRKAYLEEFTKRVDANKKNNDRIIISSGIAEYDPAHDTSIIQVFTRADREMYVRKQHLKADTSAS